MSVLGVILVLMTLALVPVAFINDDPLPEACRPRGVHKQWAWQAEPVRFLGRGQRGQKVAPSQPADSQKGNLSCGNATGGGAAQTKERSKAYVHLEG